jgi:hypothetical protein
VSPNDALMRTVLLTEGGELDQVVVGDSLYWISGFAPGAQASGDYEYFESQLL